MSGRDPETLRQYRREYMRKYRQENPEKVREIRRRSAARNRQTETARTRKWEKENPERYRAIKARQAEQGRKAWAAGYRQPKIVRRDQLIAAYWQMQGGTCYLGGEPLAVEKAILEHDHRCCPDGEFCDACVRGAACQQCNTVIGLALDDPGRLRRIADALEIAKAAITQRLAECNEQGLLLEGVS